jgi:hypothetical protein
MSIDDHEMIARAMADAVAKEREAIARAIQAAVAGLRKAFPATDGGPDPVDHIARVFAEVTVSIENGLHLGGDEG